MPTLPVDPVVPVPPSGDAVAVKFSSASKCLHVYFFVLLSLALVPKIDAASTRIQHLLSLHQNFVYNLGSKTKLGRIYASPYYTPGI